MTCSTAASASSPASRDSGRHERPVRPADRRDKHHARCADWLQRTPDVLMVPATVLAETCYLIDKTLGPTAEAAFIDSVGTGPEHTFQRMISWMSPPASITAW